MKSKRSKACDISSKVRAEVRERDSDSCIFCGRWLASPQLAHYISRGRGGLGIARNLTCVCPKCHMELDQGSHTKEYEEIQKKYLQSCYSDWQEEELFYKK